MTVPVRGTIRAERDGRFTERHASEIGERLIALEKALRGTVASGPLSPSVPPFGPGTPGAPGSPGAPGAPGAPGVSDHGLLTGLEDDDHPQYVQRLEPPRPHAHQTGPASDFVNTPSSAGVSTLLAAADHKHLRDVRVEKDGTDVDIVHALDIRSPAIDVEIHPNLTGSLLTGLVGYWPLNERSGSRFEVLASGPPLVQTGTVPYATGRFGGGVSSTEAAATALTATFSPAVALSAGLTIAVWFKWPAFPSVNPDSLLALDNGAGPISPYVLANRFYDSNYLEVGFRWAAGAGGVVGLPLPRLGPFDINTWHLLVVTYDATTGDFTGMVDQGCLSMAAVWNAVPLPAWKLRATVPGASLAAANASTFTRLDLLRRFSGAYVDFEGSIDAPMIWTKALTALETEQLWISRRAELSVNPYALHVNPHSHVMKDVADLRPDDSEFVIAQRMFGG